MCVCICASHVCAGAPLSLLHSQPTLPTVRPSAVQSVAGRLCSCACLQEVCCVSWPCAGCIARRHMCVCVCVRAPAALVYWGGGHGGCLCKRPSAPQSFVCVPSCNTPTHSLQGLRVHVCHHRCAACECAVCERAHVRVRCAACAAAIDDQHVVHLLLCKSAPMRAPTCKCTCARGLWYMCARPSGAAVVPCSPCRAV